jgi:hypothetical protein
MASSANVSELVLAPKDLAVTHELLGLAHLVEDACPCKTKISFSFDHALHIAVDVRTLEEAHMVEAMLPRLAGGVFQHVNRSAIPNHAFLKRVTATVNR